MKRRRCQYCLEFKMEVNHLCPVRLEELDREGVSPGRPKLPLEKIPTTYHQGKKHQRTSS